MWDLTVDERQMINVPSTFGVYSIAEVWEWINNLNREVKNNDMPSCHLYCDTVVILLLQWEKVCTNIILDFPKIGMVLSSLLDLQL